MRTAEAERAVKAFVEAAGRLQLGCTFELKVPPPEGRGNLRLVVRPPEGDGPGPRRWLPVVHALQTLVEATLARAGLSDVPVDVELFEVPVEGRPPREREDAGLVAAARGLAEVASRLGRPFALGPMTSNERRQVHQALGEVPQVWTQSEGEGIFRRLWVVPRGPKKGAAAPPAEGGGADDPAA